MRGDSSCDVVGRTPVGGAPPLVVRPLSFVVRRPSLVVVDAVADDGPVYGVGAWRSQALVVLHRALPVGWGLSSLVLRAPASGVRCAVPGCLLRTPTARHAVCAMR